MRRTFKYFVLLLLINAFSAYGQGENNMWCFGTGGGLNFNAGPPTLFVSYIVTAEGCASVSDAMGNLLFYASPVAVFDRNNNIMPNGAGLLGDVSSTQGAAVIQSFTNPAQYYLFTSQSLTQNTGYLYYSLVDMTLNNGFGDVVAGKKNILIDSNTSEKMVVAKGGGCFNWLLVHDRDAPIFHAFKVDAGGVNSNPVISVSGFSYAIDRYDGGEMKVAPNDSSVVLVNDVAGSAIELHTFNNSSGTVSNAIDLDSQASAAWYGVSYSPDGSKLYVPTQSGTPAALFQYNMSLLPDIAAVRNSRTVIANGVYYGMRIGPDNKVYLIKDGQMSVIDNPNMPGPACNFNMFIFTNYAAEGLGNTFIPSPQAVFSYHADSLSACLSLHACTVSAPWGYNSYLWSDGVTTMTDTFSATGTKWVRSEQYCNIRIDTFKVTALALNASNAATDTSVCLSNSAMLNAPGGYNLYTWSDASTGQHDTVSSEGTKWVRAEDTVTCRLLIDTFHVHDWRDTIKMVTDTSHCVAYSPIPIAAPGGYTSYLWSDGKIGQTDTFFSTTTKWVTALNGCNMLIDTVHFTAITIPQDSVFEHNNDTMICFDAGPVIVSAPAGYTLYLWSDGVNTQSDVFSNTGTKWVYAQKLCYLLIDTFSVLAKPTDTLAGRVDTMICFSNGTTLLAVSGYDTYLWSDGNTGITDTFSQTSVKRVYSHRACEERIDTFHVQFINDLSVDLGADTAVCKGESLTLNATSIYNTAKYLWQDGETNATCTVTEGGDYSVKVSVGPCNVSDTVRVHQKVIDIKLKDGLIPCHEESVTLDAGVDNANYLWQDGSRNRTYKATKEGSYTLKVTQDDCSASATVTVRFEGCPCNVVIPTAFSPNNDGKNDKFGLTVSCPINSFKLMVYNRWGNQVFYSEDVNQKWDGTCKGIAVDGDVFNYYLEFKDGDNKTYNYKGNVTLVR